MPELVVGVADLSSRAGATKEIAREVSLPGLRNAMGWVEEEDRVRLALSAEGLVEGVVVSGRVSGTLHLACSRCLKEYEEDFEQPVDEVFYYEQGKEKGGYEVQHDTIDLEPVVRDVVVLGIPGHPLHDPHCKGLCPDCGADLNLIECGHGHDRVDPRWVGLTEIAGHLKERS